MNFDWTSYIDEQLRWAECLISKAKECEGNDRQQFYDWSKSALVNAIQSMEKIPSQRQR